MEAESAIVCLDVVPLSVGRLVGRRQPFHMHHYMAIPNSLWCIQFVRMLAAGLGTCTQQCLRIGLLVGNGNQILMFLQSSTPGRYLDTFVSCFCCSCWSSWGSRSFPEGYSGAVVLNLIEYCNCLIKDSDLQLLFLGLLLYFLKGFCQEFLLEFCNEIILEIV